MIKRMVLAAAALLAAAPALAQEKPIGDQAILDSTIVYLASYRTEALARTGYARLSKASPILARQDPRLMNVDLGKKGQWVRVYALAVNEAERATLCKQLGKLVDECGSRLRE